MASSSSWCRETEEEQKKKKQKKTKKEKVQSEEAHGHDSNSHPDVSEDSDVSEVKKPKKVTDSSPKS